MYYSKMRNIQLQLIFRRQKLIYKLTSLNRHLTDLFHKIFKQNVTEISVDFLHAIIVSTSKIIKADVFITQRYTIAAAF